MPGVHRHRQRERLEGRAELEHAERRAVEHLVRRRLARRVRIERSAARSSPALRRCGRPSPRPPRRSRRNAASRRQARASSACWTRLSRSKARAAVPRVRGSERYLSNARSTPAAPWPSMSVKPSTCAARRRLRIEPVGLALDRKARLAERVDRLDQRRARRGGGGRRTACPSAAARNIAPRYARASAGRAAARARACRRSPCSGWTAMVQASIVRAERLAVAVDDVAALGDQARSVLPCARHGRRKRRDRGSAAR